MVKYLNPSLVQESFLRLASKTDGGKSHLERTSAILYFLAFDAVCHSNQKCELDFDPDRFEGKDNRRKLELEFSKLVLLDTEYGQKIQYFEFGKIDATNVAPEKRLSANFLTVPLKKATTESQPSYYPKRPNAPLLKLGAVATKKKWGISRHEDFEKNLFVVMNSARSSTPAYDLAIVILRNSEFLASQQNIFNGLHDQLAKKFTPEVCALFKKRIDKEKILVKTSSEYFVDHHINFIKAQNKKVTIDNRCESMSREELIAKIEELEAKIYTLINKA